MVPEAEIISLYANYIYQCNNQKHRCDTGRSNQNVNKISTVIWVICGCENKEAATDKVEIYVVKWPLYNYSLY